MIFILYLTAPQSKSCAIGFFYLGNTDESIINGSILYLTTIIKNGIVLAAEIAASLFLNARMAIQLCTTLVKMVHPNSATKIEIDNTTANGFVNGIIKQKKTKQKQ